MAGILPVAYHNEKTYFLFSRESIDVTWKDKGKWSDFGGSREKGESLKTTAIRECVEESDGIFGKEKDIKYLIEKSLIKKFCVNHYTTYVIQVPYEPDLPKSFRKEYLEVLKKRRDLVIARNGLYEKDMLRWIELKNLKKFIPKMRPWYKAIARVILKHFNKKE